MPVLPVIELPSFEQHPTGFGIGIASPRLSWRFLSTSDGHSQGWQQTAYEIQIVRLPSLVEETHLVASDASVLVPWPSAPLKSREAARVRVRAEGASDGAAGTTSTEWSPWATVETALLNRDDWSALPIARPVHSSEDGPLRPVRFRKYFHLSGEKVLQKARLYITSFGVYRAFVNGREVGDQCLAPGWTSYHHRLNYQTYDIAALLNPNGPNAIAIEVGEGWYATRLGFRGGRRKLYGDRLAALAQLEAQFDQDTEAFSLITDSTWFCQPSAIIASEFYDGELYDAREDDHHWNSHSMEASTFPWTPVEELAFPAATLVSPNSPPVRVTEEIAAVNILHTPSGKTVVDFGQNLVGRLRLRSLNKPKGTQVTLIHAEVMENGELGTRPLRHAKCTDTIISAGTEITNWSPQYTFHGFRYVQVDGWSPEEDDLLLTHLTALVMHTDMSRTGWFSCSNPMVNQLHQNAWWSMRGNFLSIPTDCPQRDERLGWTGDIQVFCPSASFLYNTAGILGDWLQDVAVEQSHEGDGSIPPFVVPNVISKELWPHVPQAIWDDVVILTPWALYQSYQDSDILRRQYSSMLAWIDRGIQRGPEGLWDSEIWQLGDWLDPTAPPIEPGDARTNGTLVADAYLVRITSVMAQISEILGEKADHDRFKADSQELKVKFQAKYIASSGLLVGDSQTALSLAIVFGLHSSVDQTATAAARLVDLVRLAKFRVATGFAGTPIITHALSRTGHHQVAYRMLLEKNRPSWMYPITMGATTMWERWDSVLPDGSINPGEMTSFNHYAFGSIINWLHSTVAGVSPGEPGWKTVLVEPIPGGTIESAEAIYETPYGRLECRWAIHPADDHFELELLVPPNSRALVKLPSEERWNKKAFLPSADDGKWVGSGHHQFSCRWGASSYRGGWPPKAKIPFMRRPEPESLA